jgi:hypothetical protein
MAAQDERQRLATKAGVTLTQAVALSGADLAQKALLNATGTTLGPGIDGATLMKSHGGPA